MSYEEDYYDEYEDNYEDEYEDTSDNNFEEDTTAYETDHDLEDEIWTAENPNAYEEMGFNALDDTEEEFKEGMNTPKSSDLDKNESDALAVGAAAAAVGYAIGRRNAAKEGSSRPNRLSVSSSTTKIRNKSRFQWKHILPYVTITLLFFTLFMIMCSCK